MRECGAPGALVDGHEAEKLLEAALDPVLGQGACPNHDQLAWSSLGNSASRPRTFVPGSKEMYYWRAKPGATWRDP